jgi:hypothetical protein
MWEAFFFVCLKKKFSKIFFFLFQKYPFSSLKDGTFQSWVQFRDLLLAVPSDFFQGADEYN